MSFLRRVLGLPPTLAPYATVDERLNHLERSASRADRRLAEWARELAGPGEVVWDAASGSGMFSLASAIAAGPTGAVLALERDRERAAHLLHAARGLGARDARLDVLEVEVGDPAEAGATVAKTGAGQAGPEPASLDSLLERFRAPTLLRVGSAESGPRALAGARRILAEIQPVILIEVKARDADEIGGLLRARGYKVFDAETNPRDRMHLDLPVLHTLAIPG